MAPNLYNKNLKFGMSGPETSEGQQQLPTRKTMHQVLLTTVYNKVIFFHLDPLSALVHIYELDPTFTYKNNHAIMLLSPPI